jgi:hypothetical protein
MKGVKSNEAVIVAIHRCDYTVVVRDGHDGTNADAVAKPDGYPVAEPVTYPFAISEPLAKPVT